MRRITVLAAVLLAGLVVSGCYDHPGHDSDRPGHHHHHDHDGPGHYY